MYLFLHFSALETTEINKVGDCIQLILNELRNLLIEVQGLMSSCCKETSRLGKLFKHSDQLLNCLTNTSFDFDKNILEPKEVSEIPAYYLSMMLMCEVPVKTEEEEVNTVRFIRNKKTFKKKSYQN